MNHSLHSYRVLNDSPPEAAFGASKCGVGAYPACSPKVGNLSHNNVPRYGHFRKMLTKESTFWGFPSFRQVSEKPRYMGKAWKKAATGGCGLLMMRPWGLRLKPGPLFLVKGSCRLRPPKFCFGNCPDAQMRQHFPSQNH